jgi:hypothetical protein
MEFNNFSLKCPFAHIHKNNIELPLNLSIRGVQNKCMNKLYVMHMTYISHNSKIKEVNRFCQPNSGTPEIKTRNLQVYQLYQDEGLKFRTSRLQTQNLRVCQAELSKNSISSKQTISTK